MTIEQFENWSTTICITGLILYMLFVVYKLAKESNAGKFGYLVLFIALGLGMFGFVAKVVLVEIMKL